MNDTKKPTRKELLKLLNDCKTKGIGYKDIKKTRTEITGILFGILLSCITGMSLYEGVRGGSPLWFVPAVVCGVVGFWLLQIFLDKYNRRFFDIMSQRLNNV
jgi:hypothetical protein